MIAVIDQHAALAEGTDVVLVAVIVEGHEEVGFITRAEDVPGTHADLEDRRASGDRRRDRHVGHDILGTTASQTSEERPDGLNTVLGVARHADDNVVERLGGNVGCGGVVGWIGQILANHVLGD